MPDNCYVEIVLEKRSLFGRILYLPKAYNKFYEIFRRKQGIAKSLQAAWIMAEWLIKPVHEKKQ